MLNLSVNGFSLDALFNETLASCYIIPKFQREYTWNQNQWRDLYDDIIENKSGYFMGSIICIKDTNNAYLEVIDGQQRLTTLCLLLAAIYHKLNELEDKFESAKDWAYQLFPIERLLKRDNAPHKIALCPQEQNNNLSDFMVVMGETILSDGKTIEPPKKEKNWGNRKIAKCYKYFLQRIEQDLQETNYAIEHFLEIKNKVLASVLVKIEVTNHADAYTLFESLNNRGVPLTAIDLMKNLILAKADEKQLNVEKYFQQWQKLLSFLTDDYSIQERFFRHYYNAFKNRLNEPYRTKTANKKDPLGSIATRSNLLGIYESLINDNLPNFLKDVLGAGELYSQFILNSEEQTPFKQDLANLSHIQGTPSYLLLLYLFKQQKELKLRDQTLLKIIQLLTRFFVRRNATDWPGTRDLTRLFMDIISKIEKQQLSGNPIYQLIREDLVRVSASDELFKEKLSGNIYEDNVGVARYVLCDLAQRAMTTETWTNLWAQNEYKSKKVFKWTIEHIFPEGKNIPDCWVDMIAEGDRSLANQYLETHVHKLGNLTLTGYNPDLSNLSFEDKRDRKKNGLYIGYKNKLGINKELSKKKKWTIKDIDERTETFVEQLLAMYKL